MKEILLSTLIDKDLFKVSTEVDINYSTITLGNVQQCNSHGTFTVSKISFSTRGRAMMEGISIADGSYVSFDVSKITAIDGMTPERFAENYLLTEDGLEIKITGKKRGRRPNNPQ